MFLKHMTLLGVSIIFVMAPIKVFAQEQEMIELNAVTMPKTNFRGLWHFGQELVARGPLERKEKLKDAFGFSFEIEMPIWKYFASGFYLQGYKGLSVINLRTGSGLLFGSIEDPTADPIGLYDFGYSVFGVGAFIKPQVEIPFFYGNLALSLRIPFGIESILGNSRIGLFKNQDDVNQFKSRPDSIISAEPRSGFMGYGLRTGASIGLEYFPVYLVGLFAEAGYEGAYHFFALKLREQTLGPLGPSGFASSQTKEIDAGLRGYFIHGWTAMAGVKVTY